MKNKRRWTWKRKHTRNHSFTYKNDSHPPKRYHRTTVLKPNRMSHRKLEREILMSTDYDNIKFPTDIDNSMSAWCYW